VIRPGSRRPHPRHRHATTAVTEPHPGSGHPHTSRDLQFRRLTATVAELEAALAEARTDQDSYRRPVGTG